MTTNHVDFEVLCALAASGDLTKAERARLSDHVQQCVLCYNRLFEMRQLGIQLFLAQALKTPTRRLPRGMQERFSARAISEGIPLSSRSQGVGFSPLGLVTALLVVLLMVAATLRDGHVQEIRCRNRRGRFSACFTSSEAGDEIAGRGFETFAESTNAPGRSQTFIRGLR